MKPVPSELTMKLMDGLEAQKDGHGIDMSIDDLAKSSGVPRATLYYYFAGKEDLVQFYVGEMVRRANESVAKSIEGGGTPVARLEAVLRSMMRTYAEYPRMCVEMSVAIKFLQNYGPVMAEMERGVLAPMVALLEEGTANGDFDVPDPMSAAIAMTGGMHMLATMDIVHYGKLDADARSDVLIPQMMRGLLAR
ncbi:MAG: TetR/AcrR family transcriptional regulator [Chloroflexota bacterium]